jgi:hypothetical protein
MFKNEKLNKILHAVSKDDPQNKMTTLFLLKFVQDLIDTDKDDRQLEIVKDIKNILSDEEANLDF